MVISFIVSEKNEFKNCHLKYSWSILRPILTDFVDFEILENPLFLKLLPMGFSDSAMELCCYNRKSPMVKTTQWGLLQRGVVLVTLQFAVMGS